MSIAPRAFTGLLVAGIVCAACGDKGSEVLTVASISISDLPAEIEVGTTAQLTAQVMCHDGSMLTDRTVTWSTSDPLIATITSGGLLVAMAPGPVIVQAACEGVSQSGLTTVVPRAVASVDVTPPTASISVGETVQLAATLRAEDGTVLTGRTVSWSSGSASVAMVSSGGLVAGVSAGTATITATSEGKSGTAQVTVEWPVHSVEISPSTASIRVGETVSLSATLRAEDGTVLTGRTVTWTSATTSVATVSSAGVVTGVSEGTATIVATSEGQSGTAQVIVIPPVHSVEVSPSTATVGVGQTVQLTVTLRAQDGTVLSGRTVTWTSDDESVATVDPEGLVTGVSPGTATATATSEGRSGTAQVTVAPPVHSVEVSPSTATIGLGQTVQLTATLRAQDGTVLTGRVVTWSSSNTSVATVGSSGVVTGVAEGTASITAASEGATGSATVTVRAPVGSVEVSPPSATVTVGGTIQLTAIVLAGDGTVLSGRLVTWSSGNSSVAAVDATGRVTGISDGTATVTATSEGVSGSATVTVGPAVGSVTLTPQGHQMRIGWGYRYTATVRDTHGGVMSDASVAWSSSNPSVASVDQDGRARGEADGSAQIRATAGGVTGAATLKISSDPCFPITIWPPHETVNGSRVNSADCFYWSDGYPSEYFAFTSAQQFSIVAAVTESAFEPLTRWLRADGAYAPQRSAGGIYSPGGSSVTGRALMGAGNYLLGIHSHDGSTGTYNLDVTWGSRDPEVNCEHWFLVPPTDYDGSLSTADCSADGSYVDRFLLMLYSGETVTISYSSSQIDNLLGLFDSDGTLVASDDDSGGQLDAWLQYTATSSTLHTVFLTSYADGETGTYRLQVSISGGSAPMGAPGRLAVLDASPGMPALPDALRRLRSGVVKR